MTKTTTNPSMPESITSEPFTVLTRKTDDGSLYIQATGPESYLAISDPMEATRFEDFHDAEAWRRDHSDRGGLDTRAIQLQETTCDAEDCDTRYVCGVHFTSGKCRECKLDDYEAGIMDGSVLRNIIRSADSEIGYRPPITSREVAKWIKGIAAIPAAHSGSAEFTQLATAILRALPGDGLTFGQYRAKVAGTALAAFEGEWFDTYRAAGPDPGRHSENVHQYGMAARLTLLYILSWMQRDTVPGPGWALMGVIERHPGLHIHVVERAIGR